MIDETYLPTNRLVVNVESCRRGGPVRLAGQLASSAAASWQGRQGRAILDLLHRYGHVYDQGQLDGLAGLFTHEAVSEFRPGIGGMPSGW